MSTKHPNGTWPGGKPRSHGNAFDAIYGNYNLVGRPTGMEDLARNAAISRSSSAGVQRRRERGEAADSGAVFRHRAGPGRPPNRPSGSQVLKGGWQ